ncbi:MAG: T9SS type A sorting domain-containing protein [Bacteroidetes bacterium]|nr:T9SS type A sorting domain-containing protein [Bacteroidota bacterium]MCL2302867.1 T9SS type A sorting domain-containing protein [Lentimicrobiaceae bacterium]
MKKTSLLILLCLAMFNLFAWEGNGTIENPYKISSPQDLIALSEASESFEGIYFQQTQTIDMQTYQGFKPIGTKNVAFQGNYDGQNYGINNLKITEGYYSNQRIALFGSLSTGAVIRNLYIGGASHFEGTNYVGSIAGECYFGVTIDNCSSSATVIGLGTDVGGIVGKGYIVKNCSFLGSVTVDYIYGSRTGGVAGSVSETIERCSNFGTVKGHQNVGGVCGFIATDGMIVDCYNKGSVTGTSDYVGGVAGYVSSGLISTAGMSRCHNDGSVKGVNYVGGVVGYTAITDVAGNTGNVEAQGEFVGGVAGSGTIYRSYNRGAVTGSSSVGGVIGLLSEANNCYNTGAVSGSNRVGGLVGSANGTSCKLRNSYNAGSVSSTENLVGGIVGFMNTGGLVNSNEITNTYWNSDVYTGDGVGNLSAPTTQFQYYPKTSAELRNGFSATLGSATWKEDDAHANSGYPILREEAQISVKEYPSMLSDVKVYSFGNQIHIANNTQIEIKQVEVMDIRGRSIYRNSLTSTAETITLNVPSGVYIVRLFTGNETKAYKVVLTK